MKDLFSLGIDFGTNTVRALILNLNTGSEVVSASCDYCSGEKGILIDKNNPHLARQCPGDYLQSMEIAVKKAIDDAKTKGVYVSNIVGIGVDATASTPIPVDENLKALAFYDEFKDNLNAKAWLWKDHTSVDEAIEITELASKIRPNFLKMCGGAYSSEWFFSKIYNCYKIDRKVFDAAYSWIELPDYIPAILCGINDVKQVKRGVCAAGHKAMFNNDWGGLPDDEFLEQLAPELTDLRSRLYDKAYSIDEPAGFLCKEWAEKFGINPYIPVAIGIIDAHCGAVGSGVGESVLVKIIGTSACDIMVHPNGEHCKDIPGVAGVVNESVLPNYIGIEAGQSAVGDIFNWFITSVLNEDESYHEVLTKKAGNLKAGESGLLALDWNNGNRNILADANLSGLILGQSLHTKDYEIYRALIEATAFGALRIIEQMEIYGVTIEKVITCGGITQKNPMFMQIYADVIGKPMFIAENKETVALGAAIIGGFVALKGKQGFESIEAIQKKACKVKDEKFIPNPEAHNIYRELYKLYKKLHDAFGLENNPIELYSVMKKLLDLKQNILKK